MILKVLVVDNNPVLLRAVSAMLMQEGCVVRTAGSGLEALEIIDDFSPDIVFTDLIMPMVSGEQLCRILRHTKKHENVFIVILSAIIVEDRLRILQEVPCDICIAKGNLQEIRQHVREALQAYRARCCNITTRATKAARIPHGLQPSELTGELLSEKRHFFDILANLEDGILELNHQGKVVSANAAALKILSCREEVLVGRPLYESLDWGKFSKAVQQWTEQQLMGFGLKKYAILEDAPLFFGDRTVTASFMPIAETGSIFGLCILRDITRQYKAEKHHKELDNALRLVKKMDAMSCMAGGFSHDFNNLLTAICGYLDILIMHGENQSGEDRKNLLHQAKKAALVAVDLTRQISCFSNFGIVSREKVNLESLVRNTIDQFFNGKNQSCGIKVFGNGCFIHADPEELSQAIVNVLQNALEASSGQRLEVILDENEFTSPQLLSGQYVPAGTYARIDICDEGQGIHPEQLFRIFDPYFSTKERGALKGMGLGLTVVYAILRNHGGYVVVDSVIKSGTTVSLYLPALLDDAMIYPLDAAFPAEKRRVLLIEPEKQMGEIGQIMLRYLGFSVRVASDRAEAIDELQQFIDDPLLPKPLVILDLSSKNGESAVETCRALHEIDPALKIIAMSGSILDPVMANYRDYGFVNTIPKPFSMDSLKHITNTVYHT
jgi:signal transduction histidine kinase/CheY-like chemotaxis protein